MIIISNQDIFIRCIDKGVRRTGISFVTQHQFDFDLFSVFGCLGMRDIDRPGIVVVGLHLTIRLNSAHLDHVAGINPLPASQQRPEIVGPDRIVRPEAENYQSRCR